MAYRKFEPTVLVNLNYLLHIFLTILVFAIMIMARCVAYIDQIWPAPVAEVKTSKKKATTDDTEVAIAIVRAMAA